MRIDRIIALCALLAAAACQPPPQQFVGVGDVVSFDDARRELTIRHDEIVGLMPAATTSFLLADDAPAAGATAGERVRFVLRRQGEAMRITTMTPLEMGNPGVHDHTPHHGGVVGMIGMLHLEARAERDGRIVVYLTDRYRRPLPLSDVHGSVIISSAGNKQAVPFAVGKSALEAAGPVLQGSEVHVDVRLMWKGEALDMTFQLPIAGERGGAAGIPVGGCSAPSARQDGARLPRCTVQMLRPVGVLASDWNGQRVLVAGADIGVSMWHVAPPRFLVGFESAPAVKLLAPEAPHIEIANAIAVHPDGSRAVVALESRLLTYETASGRLLNARAHSHGIVHSLAWSPAGDAVLVTAFYDASARLIAADDGRELRAFRVDQEATAAAFAADGKTIAAADVRGPVVVFDAATGTRLRTMSEAQRVTRSVTFVGAGLVASGDDGLLRYWDLTSDSPAVELGSGTATAVAAEAGGGRVASAGRDGAIRVYDVRRGALIAELRRHSAPPTAVVWAGSTIISADAEGQIAFWDEP